MTKPVTPAEIAARLSERVERAEGGDNFSKCMAECGDICRSLDEVSREVNRVLVSIDALDKQASKMREHTIYALMATWFLATLALCAAIAKAKGL